MDATGWIGHLLGLVVIIIDKYEACNEKSQGRGLGGKYKVLPRWIFIANGGRGFPILGNDKLRFGDFFIDAGCV
jgi:hypothetical protein